MAGEEAQDTGREGLQRAKQWLELSTRVRYSWSHEDRVLGDLLHFRWPHGTTRFSFDLGGKFQGAPLDDQSFLAEVKKYRNESDLPIHFRDFLAKCYVALGGTHPERCDNFLWISWSPFQARSWDQHATTDSVRKAVIHEANRQRVLGVDSESDALAKLDAELMSRVARQIWLITLCDQQEQLVLSESHYHEVATMIAKERGFRS